MVLTGLFLPGGARVAWADDSSTELIDDTDSRFVYSGGGANNGGWGAGSPESGDPVTSEHWANAFGATLDISFNGTKIELCGKKAANHGMFKWWLDDEAEPQISDADYQEHVVDCYGSEGKGALLLTVDNLKAGDHVLHIANIKQWNDASTSKGNEKMCAIQVEYAKAYGVEIDMDKDVTTEVGTGQVTSGEEPFKFKFEGGNWSLNSNEGYTKNDGSGSWSMTFIGSGIDIYAAKDPGHGVYAVTLDGEPQDDISAISEKRENNVKIGSFSGLEEGEHTIELSLKEGECIQINRVVVTHKPITATQLSLSSGDFTLEAGSTKELSYSIPSYAIDPGVEWSTSDDEVATVSNEGVVEAKSVSKKSEATITAKLGGSDVSASVTVKVFPAVKGFNAFVGDEKILDLPANAYEDAKTDFTDEWSDTAWRGDKRASKIGVATRDAEVKDVRIEVSDFKTEDGATLSADNVDVKWLREVDADANRGMSGKMVSYPDVIYYANDGQDIPASKLQFAWVSISVPTDAKPGVYHGTLTVKAGDVSYPLSYTLEVLNLVQPTAREVGYSVQLWQHPFSATGYYFGKSTVDATSSGSGLWGAPIGTDAPIDKFMDEDFQAYYKGILTDYAEIGGNDLVANIVDDAWGHQCYYSDSGMVTWTKTADGWEFDYTLFDEWVKFAIECGVIDPAEGYGAIKCYSMIPWNNRITYIDETDGGKEKTVDLEVNSNEWKAMWTPFLNDFMAHLDEQGWFGITYIAFDEREGVDTVCKFIKEHKLDDGRALKTAAAINYDPNNIGDHMYIDDVSVGQKHVLSSWEMDEWYAFVDERREEGLKTTMYTCTGDYPNSSQQADPGDIYWSALYSQSLHTDGYLRWALDAWINDMYGDTSYINWEPGDPWFIYPLELGEDGAYDPAKLAENPSGFYSSPRYEMFKQGARDVCKARYLQDLGGDVAASVTALFDGMQFPEGSNNLPNNEAERMLTHSETDRVYAGLTEIARTVEEEPEPVDKTALKQALDKAAGLNEADWTADSWTAFVAKRDAAQAVSDNPDATEEQVATATDELLAAIDALDKVVEPEPGVDKGDLSDALDAVKPESEAGKYTADSWKAYRDAVEYAQGVLADEDATQEQVDAVLAALKAAEQALVKVEGEKPEEKPEQKPEGGLPQTGDSTLLAVGTCALIAGAAIAGAKALSRRRR